MNQRNIRFIREDYLECILLISYLSFTYFKFFKWLYMACQQGVLPRKSKPKPKPVLLELFRLYVLLNTHQLIFS